MGKNLYTVISNIRAAEKTYAMVLRGDASGITSPGQFVNVAVDGFFLRRPISVSDWTNDSISIIYKVVGRGTDEMSKWGVGKRVDLLTGLGRGFDPAPARGKKIALIGGGSGTPPLVGLARVLNEQGEKVSAVLGFNSRDEVFGEDYIGAYTPDVKVATLDGSRGTKGFVTDILNTLDYDYYFACGPRPMLAAVHSRGKDGQLSLESRMGCGFGACMGCGVKTADGYKRVCADGPVFSASEVTFDGE